jgi:hypothetical protein
MSGGVALLSSCSNDKLDEPEPEPTDVQGEDNNDTVYIDIMTDDVTSRAGESESDVVGTTEENYIDPATIHLYPYNFTAGDYPSWCCNYALKDGAQLNIPELTKEKVTKISGGYRITLKRKEFQDCCPSSNSTDYPNMVIVAIANWGITPEDKEFKNDVMYLVALKRSIFMYNTESTENTFNFPSTYTPSTTQPIPMYGMIVATNADINNTSVTNLGTLYLYRSLAKLIVKVPLSLLDQFEEGITLKHCYNSGTCGPANLVLTKSHVITTATSSGVYNNLASSNINIPGELSIIDEWQVTPTFSDTPDIIDDLEFNVLKKDDDYIWYQLYVPEFRIKDATITIGRNGRSGKSGSYDVTGVDNYIEFTDKSGNAWKLAFENSAGEAFDIIRNHIYVFEVTGIKSTLSLKYTVVDWDERVSGDIHFD